MYFFQPISPDTFHIDLTDLHTTSISTKDVYHFILILSDTTRFKIGRQWHSFSFQDIAMFLPYESIDTDTAQETISLNLSVDAYYMKHTIHNIDDLIHNYRVGQIEYGFQLQEQFAKVSKMYLASPDNLSLDGVSMFYQFLYTLSHPKKSFNTENHLSTQDDNDYHASRISEIEHYVEMNFNRKPSMSSLAAHLGLTPQYLSKFIKEHYGFTYNAYLNSVRLDHAVNEIIHSDHSITEIAYNNGFPNQTSFNKAFKDKYHMTPSAYKKHTHKENLPITDQDTDLLPVEVRANVSNQLDSLIEQAGKIEAAVGNIMTISASVSNPVLSNDTFFELLNLGFADAILSSDFQTQVIDLQKELHFKYARIQGLLDPNIIFKIPDTNTYNFTHINRILDFLYAQQLLPFLEIGRKPRKLNKDKDHYLFIEDTHKIEKSIEDQTRLISGFLHHCINRYGISEVEKWRFEYWLPHEHYLDYIPNTIELYIIYYKNVYTTIKSIVPLTSVGGFGFNLASPLNFFEEILQKFMHESVTFDFISLSNFHSVAPDERGTKPNYISPDPDYLQKKAKELENIPLLSDIPIIMTEWNFDYTTRNYVNDTTFKALFLVKNLLDKPKNISALGYWFFSDITSEYRDTTKILFGGSGMITVNGIKKPPYFAYIMLSKLKDRVIDQGNGYILTTNERDRYTLLLYNYVHPSYDYCYRFDTHIDPMKVNDIFDKDEIMDFHIELKAIKPGRYRIKTYKLNKHHGSILDEWVKMGSLSSVSSSEVQYFKNITTPSQRVHYKHADTSLIIDDKLEANEIRLLSIKLEF